MVRRNGLKEGLRSVIKMIMDGWIEIIKSVDLNKGKDKEKGLKVLEQIKSYVEKINGFNEMPEPYREISEDDYIYFSMLESPIATEYRQVAPEWLPTHPERVYLSVCIFYYHTFALAVAYPSKWYIDYRNTFNGIKYENKMRYYLIGKKIYEIEEHRRRNGYD